MTCGVCHPEAFRENGNRVFGYVVTGLPGRAETDMRQLHYLGAEYVFSDEPKGNVRFRPMLRILRKIMQRGDKLIMAEEKALGTKPKYVSANIAMIEEHGIKVGFIDREFFED